MSVISAQADIVVRDRHGNLAVLVELKNVPRLSSGRAEELRESMGLEASGAPFLLVLSQDRGYLWRLGANGGTATRVELDMKQALRRYWPPSFKSAHIREGELGLLVQQWLWDLVNFGATLDAENGVERQLDEIGLLKTIRYGDVMAESAR